MNPDEQSNTPLLTKTILIPSERTKIHMVEKFMDELRRMVDFRESVLDNIIISITEAVNNGIIHGNSANPAKYVHLTCNCYLNYFEFVIEDEGSGFNPDDIPDPFHEDNLLKEGGRGILIINAMMEDVHYERTGNGMRITMRIER